MPAFLTFGIVLGRPAGFSPGARSALGVPQIVRHGMRGGMKGVLAPLLNDLPVILPAAPVLTRISVRKTAPGGMPPLGAAVFACIARGEARTTGHKILKGRGGAHRSPDKGVPTNFLGPRSCPFRLTVGGPLGLRDWVRSRFSPLFPGQRRSAERLRPLYGEGVRECSITG